MWHLKEFKLESKDRKMIALRMRDSIDKQRKSDLKNQAKAILTTLHSLHQQILTIKEQQIKKKLLPNIDER